MLEQIDQLKFQQIETNYVVIFASLLLCVFYSFLLQAIYRRYTSSFSGFSNIGPVLPILAITVFLVISVVKSSLALSLGLVGALSIVRFRTPIKEPEELVFLFIAIAIGLGFGASHLVLTSVLLVVIFVVLWLRQKVIRTAHTRKMGLQLSWSNNQIKLEQVLNCLWHSYEHFVLLRYEHDVQRHLFVECSIDAEVNLEEAFQELIGLDPDFKFSFSESQSNW